MFLLVVYVFVYFVFVFREGEQKAFASFLFFLHVNVKLLSFNSSLAGSSFHLYDKFIDMCSEQYYHSVLIDVDVNKCI